MYVSGMLRKFFFTIVTMLLLVPAVYGASKRFTLVIDAGHGGKDFGAPGAQSNEKDLTLKYALSLGRMIERNCPDVSVYYTRKQDVFVTLKGRADYANDKHADLFISIHINALERNHTARGFQSYTLGRGQNTGDKGLRENLEVAKRENSVIYLEDDYRTVYKGFDANSAESDIMFEFVADRNRERSVELSRLMQNEVCRATGRPNGGAHQNNLAVLRLTSMPAVLLELGFISTPEEEQFLNSDVAHDLYTKGMYNAFILYKNKYDENIAVPYRRGSGGGSGKVVPVEPPKPAVQAAQPSASTSARELDAREHAAMAKEKALAKVKNAMGNESHAASTPLARSSRPASTGKNGALDNSRPEFRIQVLASSTVLKPGDRNLKGLEGCGSYEEGGLRKYTYGSSNNYNEIYQLRKTILDKFPECFIIAFKNGQKMDVREAIREFKAAR